MSQTGVNIVDEKSGKMDNNTSDKELKWDEKKELPMSKYDER